MKLILISIFFVLVLVAQSMTLLKKIRRKKLFYSNHSLAIISSSYLGQCFLKEKSPLKIFSNETCMSVFESKPLKIANMNQEDSHCISEKAEEINCKEIPVEYIRMILLASRCKEKHKFMQRCYGKNFIKEHSADNSSIIMLKVAGWEHMLNFNKKKPQNKALYQRAETIAKIPVGGDSTGEDFVNQFYLMFKLLKRNPLYLYNSYNFSMNNIPINSIVDRAGLYVTQIRNDLFHQSLYLCFFNKELNQADHFIFDRAARDFIHEKGSSLSKSLMTLIRVVHYYQSKICDEAYYPHNPEFEKDFILNIPIKKNLKSEDVENLIEFSKKSTKKAYEIANEWAKKGIINTIKAFTLDEMFTAIQKYAILYQVYNPFSNCQHFATKMFNYLTGENFNYINGAYFSNFLKNIDIEFEELFNKSESYSDFQRRHQENVKIIKNNNLMMTSYSVLNYIFDLIK